MLGVPTYATEPSSIRAISTNGEESFVNGSPSRPLAKEEVKLLGLRSIEEGVEIHRRLFPESRKDTQSLMSDALGAHAKP